MSNQPTSTSSSERGVHVRSVDGDTSVDSLVDGFRADGADGIGGHALKFEVKSYSMFRTEYMLNDRDLIVHFFLPSTVTEDSAQQYRDWWLNDFPSKMDEVAQEHFNAGPPRLSAKYTEEVASWWFRAQGYDHLLNPLGFLERFFEALNASLVGEQEQP